MWIIDSPPVWQGVDENVKALAVVIPGEPVAQGRPRAFYRPGLGVRVFDPAKSRSWKGVAHVHYQEALAKAGASTPFLAGPVELRVVAVFTCPKSAHRKIPVPRRPKAGRPDPDNLGKAVMDAGNGILFGDDSQVARLVVEKWIGAQGEAPFVEITVRDLTASPPAGQSPTPSLFAEGAE